MTMPTFEPIGIFFTQEQFYRTDGRSKVVWTYGVPPWGQQVFTADQLQQAYEAGKRDAAPQVEQEPVECKRLLEMVDTLLAHVNGVHTSHTKDWADANWQSADRVLEKIQTAIRALYAAPPAPAVPEWQPIETAPKDGTGFLASEPHKRPFVALWLDADHPSADDSGWYDHWNFDPVSPTHWMPLPASPEPTK